jgi:hypothetical protein
MKMMTCRELGGSCDERLSAETWDEMVQTMTAHVMAKHPDLATDPEKLGLDLRPRWEATPEV